MEREACVCDHGYERSDLCAEIIIIIISTRESITVFGKDYTCLAWFGKRYMVVFMPFDLTFRNKYKSLEFETML